MFRLRADQTKEGKKKRVPIIRLLIPYPKRVRQFHHNSNRGSLIDGLRPPSEDSPPETVVKGNQELLDDLALTPHPNIHDLRHTWKANARRSKPQMDYKIRETILGHCLK